MNGSVNESLEAILPVMLVDRHGNAFEVDTVIDTGATNWLTLPLEIIEELDLRQLDMERATMANGQAIDCRTFSCNILWFDRLRTIQIVELDMVPLFGMKLLEGSRLEIDVRIGGEVRVVQGEMISDENGS